MRTRNQHGADLPPTGAGRAASRRCRTFRVAAGVLLSLLPEFAQSGVAVALPAPQRPSLEIPRIDRAPALEDFASMEPAAWLAGRMAKVSDFVQWIPRDGQPASQRTEVYVAHDHEHLYAVYLCFDTEPGNIRARLSRREDIFRDDRVDLFLDTFDDHRRAYAFTVNPYGVQADATWIERDTSQYDPSFDTVWHSRGMLTEQGYVVWIAVPFKSLRFPSQPEQSWGIVFARFIPRVNEGAFWPRVTSRIEGRLNQSARLYGLREISSSGRIQLIPFGFYRAFRALDTGDPPRFVRDWSQLDAGLDAKLVLRDSFALDVAVNPDFNQVESDEPQVTVNQRFEVYFPEKRPFFLENASYFQTPINLFFTRRIADPQFGARLTGKAGPYAVGVLYADDESAGRGLPPQHPDRGARSHSGVFRISRDIAHQSAVGAIFTDWRLGESFNRVGGVDARIKFDPKWVAGVQGAFSSTQPEAAGQFGGSAADLTLQRTGRQLTWSLEYNDRSPGFRTFTGFLPGAREQLRPGRPRGVRVPIRPGLRGVRQYLSYRFRPEGERLIAWGPDITVNPSWNHDGEPLDLIYSLDLSWELPRQTYAGAYYTGLHERLGPADSNVLSARTDYASSRQGVFWSSNLTQKFGFQGEASRGTVVNLVPPPGQAPVLADSLQGNLQLFWYPAPSLRIEGAYLPVRMIRRGTQDSVFNNHIARAKFNWQFTRELSLRTIIQYDALLANPESTSLATNRRLNLDFLFTWLTNAWTALYVGYNNNRRNLGLFPADGEFELRRTPGLHTDSWQLFVKYSRFIDF